jgi:hypothetical protein
VELGGLEDTAGDRIQWFLLIFDSRTTHFDILYVIFVTAKMSKKKSVTASILAHTAHAQAHNGAPKTIGPPNSVLGAGPGHLNGTGWHMLGHDMIDTN